MKLLASILLLFATTAFATDNRPPDNRPPGDSNVEIKTNASSRSHGGDGGDGGSASSTVNGTVENSGNSYAEGGHATGGTGTAVSGDTSSVNEINTDFNSESTNTNVVLVPNNNTAGCNRVYGISFGNGEGAGALGVPFRDKSCDFEQAADDAAAAGEHKIAWWWRCHKKNLYKTFQGDTKEQQQLSCWNSMVAMLEPDVNFSEPQPVSSAFDMDALVVDAEEKDTQIEKLKRELEETEEQHERVEYRINQQQNLIESQAQELERLRREAKVLKEAQEQRKAEEAAVRQKFKQRLANKESK